MSGLEFVATIIQAIAWPAAVLTIVFLLRKEILRLIPKLRELEYGKFKVRFEQELKEIKESTPEISEVRLAEAISPSSIKTFEAIFHLAEVSPRAALTESWRVFETELRAGARRQNLDVSASLPSGRLLNDLHQRGMIPKDIRDVADRLRSLRNDAAHTPEFDFDTDSARGFVDVIQGLTHWIESHL